MAPKKIGAFDVYMAFAQISVAGFGGTLFWARQVLIERRGWLTDREFAEGLSIGQILPGANMINLAAMVGHRYAGYRGAVAAILGFLGLPFFVVIAIGLAYNQYGGLPVVQKALTGMSDVAAGLLLASGVQMASALPRHWRTVLFGALAFVGVGVLRWPLIGVLAVLAPLGVALAWREKR